MIAEFSKHIFENCIKIVPKPHQIDEELLHADAQTKGRTGRHNATNNAFSQNFVWIRITMNCFETFSEIHQILLYTYIWRWIRDGEGRTLWIFSWILQFLYHFNCAAQLQKTSEISGLLKDSGADTTLLPVRSTQLHTRSIGWQKCFNPTNSNLKFHAASQSFWTSLWHFPVTLLITSLQLPFWHSQFVTSYRTHSDLMSTVCIKQIQISTWCANWA